MGKEGLIKPRKLDLRCKVRTIRRVNEFNLRRRAGVRSQYNALETVDLNAAPSPVCELGVLSALAHGRAEKSWYAVNAASAAWAKANGTTGKLRYLARARFARAYSSLVKRRCIFVAASSKQPWVTAAITELGYRRLAELQQDPNLSPTSPSI